MGPEQVFKPSTTTYAVDRKSLVGQGARLMVPSSLMAFATLFEIVP